jgi:hypothetical protein
VSPDLVLGRVISDLPSPQRSSRPMCSHRSPSSAGRVVKYSSTEHLCRGVSPCCDDLPREQSGHRHRCDWTLRPHCRPRCGHGGLHERLRRQDKLVRPSLQRRARWNTRTGRVRRRRPCCHPAGRTGRRRLRMWRLAGAELYGSTGHPRSSKDRRSAAPPPTRPNVRKALVPSSLRTVSFAVNRPSWIWMFEISLFLILPLAPGPDIFISCSSNSSITSGAEAKYPAPLTPPRNTALSIDADSRVVDRTARAPLRQRGTRPSTRPSPEGALDEVRSVCVAFGITQSRLLATSDARSLGRRIRLDCHGFGDRSGRSDRWRL